MNHFYSLPLFIAFSGSYSGALDLTNQTCQLDARRQQQAYPGMSGLTPVSPFPVYNSQPDIHHNEPGTIKGLDQYDIVSLTDFGPETLFETAIHEIPQSVLDEYVPWDSGDKSDVNNALPATSDNSVMQLPGNEPEIRASTPASHCSQGYQFANPHGKLPAPQNVRPVAVVDPSYMHQTESDHQAASAEVADNSSSFAKPHRERQIGHTRKRYQTDPVCAESERARKREHRRNRYRTDPAYAERERARKRDHQRRRYQTDPVFAKCQKERQCKRYRTDPTFAMGHKIYIKTYNKVKERTSNREEASKQAKNAKEQYLQSVNPAKTQPD